MRAPRLNEPVDVYFNLAKRVWSIRSRTGDDAGRVIAYADTVVLTDVELKVNESGRQRVIREGRKNVHAFARGKLAATGGFETAHAARALWGYQLTPVTYNPYRNASFVERRTQRPVTEAKGALLFLSQAHGTNQGKLEVREAA